MKVSHSVYTEKYNCYRNELNEVFTIPNGFYVCISNKLYLNYCITYSNTFLLNMHGTKNELNDASIF